MKVGKKTRHLILILLLVLAALLPMIITDNYILGIVDMTLIYSMIALSINMIVGIAGQLDFGRAAFVGLGAYCSALMTQDLHIPFLVAFFSAGLFCALIGFALGILTSRSTFDYLTLITIGFNVIVQLVFLNWDAVTGGAVGIIQVTPPIIFGYKINTNIRYYYFALILLILCYIAIRFIINSKWGRAFQALRDDPIAASYSGIKVSYYKVLNFALASFFTGIAGSALVHYTNYANPYSFTLDESIYMLQMPILGGLGSMPGSILGSALLVIGPEISRSFYQYRLLFVGILMVILMIWAPNGILGKGGIGERVLGRSRMLLFRKHGGKE